MSRSPRGITTGGYFFKVVIFIKFKKFLVVFLALISVITLSILPASAASDDLTVEEVISKYSINYDKSECPFAVLIRRTDVTSEEYYLHISSNPNSVIIKNGFIYCNNGVLFNCFLSNNSPYYNTVNCVSNTIINSLTNSYIISSDYDILLDGSGEVFFQKTTLLKQLLNLVPQGVGEKVTADMVTLTVFGIGLIALLVGLYLVPKVLHKFQI